MNYSYGSRCAIALLLAVFFSVLSSSSVVAQAGGGGGDGDSTQFATFYTTPLTGNVEGSIVVLDPDTVVPASFSFWQSSEVVNGTSQTVTFFQTVYMYDDNGSIVDSLSYVMDVPGQSSADWTILKDVIMADGYYSLDGELGYFDAQNNAVELDLATEDFSVSN